MRLFVPLGGAIDVDKERARVSAKVADLEKYLDGINRKLSNASFLENAPQEVVLKEKEKKLKFEEQIRTLKENLSALT